MGSMLASALIDPVQFNDSDTLGIDSRRNQDRLLNGEVLLQTRSHSLWGGAVTTQIYLPIDRSLAWQQITDYPRWVQYFPDMTRSEVLSVSSSRQDKRLYQVARKAFFLFAAQVEIYLKVFETAQTTWQQIQFQLEQGSFNDFSATLKLHDFYQGTLLTYSVQATPMIPIPTQFIQEAIKLDLPNNMRQMRRVLCQLPA
ncbi:SRPBCC family protein [Leptolyngbya sp. FACHB-711]|uniref:SRPBCC family protein n=1 Tax=unclassified Leptolyngbya TaxID=2650499 RepID=UPI001F54EFB2|nr:SRPBCC family protein [Leptolyngbya sp. FACHB-711]